MKKIIYPNVMIYSILEELYVFWAKFSLPFIQMDIKSSPTELVQIYINISKREISPLITTRTDLRCNTLLCVFLRLK